MNKVSQKRLFELFDYDSQLGIFTRLVSTNTRNKAGDVAGYENRLGYIVIGIDGNSYLAHRLAWIYVYGDIPDEALDHIDMVRTNNAIANLRLCTKSENHQNIKLCHSNNKTGVLGVHYCFAENKFRAQITIQGKRISLGRFDNIKQAKDAYHAAKASEHKFSLSK